MSNSSPHKNRTRSLIRSWLGKYPGRTFHRIGIALIGFWITSSVLKGLWPSPHEANLFNTNLELSASKINLAQRPITILIISTSKDNQDYKYQNQSKDKIPKVESIVLVEIASKEPVRIIQIPIELAIRIPGESEIIPLSKTFYIGGVALSNDVIKEVINSKESSSIRYITAPINIFKKIIDQIGEITVKLDESLELKEEINGLNINISRDTYSLDGEKALRFISYSKNESDHNQARLRRAYFIKGFSKQISYPENISKLFLIAKDILKDIDTDLSYEELMSLIITALNSGEHPTITQIPLEPKRNDYQLRELKKKDQYKFIEAINQ